MPESNRDRRTHFCVLDYSPQGSDFDTAGARTPILFALWDESDRLHILVHPELSKVIDGQDLVYIESLFPDLLVRAGSDPEALFKRLSSLNVGPLVTREVGSGISDGSAALDLCAGFVELA